MKARWWLTSVEGALLTGAIGGQIPGSQDHGQAGAQEFRTARSAAGGRALELRSGASIVKAQMLPFHAGEIGCADGMESDGSGHSARWVKQARLGPGNPVRTTATETYHHALPEGTVVDHYELRRVLGAGGFGVTYLGWDVRLNCTVAVKEYLPNDLAMRQLDGSTVIPRSSADRQNYRFGLERFLEEARTLARFKEPNIVRVSNYLEANGTAYMLMEYEDGESLSDLLERRGTLTEEELKGIIIPVLDGLRAVHAQDFLHRDIKPANIYLRKDGTPILIDFGAARQALGKHSRSMTGIVTPGYAPFEQYNTRGKQGPWTDLYAVGATLYRGVTGEMPPEATERTAAQTEGEADPLIPATQMGRDRYSEGFLETIDVMLALPITQRPQTVQAVLEPLLGESASAVKPEPAPRPEPEQGRRRFVMAATGLLGVLVLVGVLWAVATGDQRQPSALVEKVWPTEAESPPPQAVVEPPSVLISLPVADGVVTTEQAIHNNPRNAHLWYQLARERLDQGDPQQAETLALKSNALSHRDAAVQALNWMLIAKARAVMRDSAGAQEAKKNARALSGI